MVLRKVSIGKFTIMSTSPFIFLGLHYFRWKIFEENVWSVSLSLYIWVLILRTMDNFKIGDELNVQLFPNILVVLHHIKKEWILFNTKWACNEFLLLWTSKMSIDMGKCIVHCSGVHWGLFFGQILKCAPIHGPCWRPSWKPREDIA